MNSSDDADGNLATRSDGATFTHDASNRLVQYSHGITAATYLHDPMGRRIRKTVDGTTTWFLWDATQLLAEYGATGIRQQRYAYLANDYAPTQVEDVNGTYYVHTDHLEAPRLPFLFLPTPERFLRTIISVGVGATRGLTIFSAAMGVKEIGVDRKVKNRDAS